MLFIYHPINLAAALILFAVWVVTRIIDHKPIMMPRLPWAYLIFIGSWILSALFTTWIPGTLYEAMLFGISLILFVAAINLPPDLRPVVLLGILISGLLFNLLHFVGIGQILAGSRSELFALNNTAAFGNLIIITSLSLLLHTKSNNLKIWAWAGLISSLVVLWFTGSRAGIIAGLAAIAVVLIMAHLMDPKIYPRPALVATAHVIGSPLFWITATARRSAGASQIAQRASRSIGLRLEIWELSLTRMMDLSRPFGLGPNTFAHRLWEIRPNVQPAWIHAHNLGIQILLERGLVGILAAAILLMIVLASVLLLAPDPMLAGIGAAVLVATLLHGIWDLPWYEPYIMRSMMLLMGLSLAPNGPNCQIDG